MDALFFRTFVGLALIIIPVVKVILAQEETITIASTQFVVNPARYILDGTTIAPGSAAVSIDGQLVSADPANDLFVDGVEVLTGHLAASLTSSLKSASAAAISSSVISSLDNGTIGSANSVSHSSSIGSGSMSALLGSSWLPTVSSQYGKNYTSALSIATISSDSGSTVLPASTDSTLYSSIASSASSNALNEDPSTNPNLASPASQSSSVVSIVGFGTGAAIYLSSTGSNSFTHQGNNSTGSSASAILGASLLSKATVSGLSALTTQMSNFNPISVTASTALGLSNTDSVKTIGPSSTASSISGSITSGPTTAMPTATVNPTGSAASAAGISLAGLIFDISQEAQTLSAIVTNSASSSSYFLKIGAVESKWAFRFKQLGGDDPPPYDTSCTGGGLTGLLKVAGCIESGLDKIKAGIEAIDKDNPGPGLSEVEGVAASIAEMAKEEEKEEDDDDDDDDDDDEQSTQNKSEAPKTQQSSNAPSDSVSSTTLSSSATSSSVFSRLSSSAVPSAISSSGSSSAVSSGSMTYPPCDTAVPQGQPASYSIDNGAAEVVLGFVGDILLSVFGGPVSGFTTSTLANSTSAMIPSTAVVPGTLSSAVNVQGITSQSAAISSKAIVPGTASSAVSTKGATSHTVLPADEESNQDEQLLFSLLFAPPAVQSALVSLSSLSAAQLKIPGQGGLSPCAEYLSNGQDYAPGTENYCFCDGILAPMLVGTVSGTTVSDCSYTTMPISGWTPTVTAGYSAPTPPSSTTPAPINPTLKTAQPFTIQVVYQCSMTVIHNEEGGKNGDQIITSCNCGDGSHPTPTPTAEVLACPLQVTSSVIEGVD